MNNEAFPGIDLKKLSDALSRVLPELTGPWTCRPFDNNLSNPTYRLQRSNSHLVIRTKPAGILLRGAHRDMTQGRNRLVGIWSSMCREVGVNKLTYK